MFYSEQDINEQRANEAMAEGFDPNVCWDVEQRFDDPNYWMWGVGLEFHHKANDASVIHENRDGYWIDDANWPACLFSAESLMSCKEANRRGYVS